MPSGVLTTCMRLIDVYKRQMNTLKVSIYGLLWGFPVPIILALLLNRIRKEGIKKKIQLLIYAPNFISVIVLCGMVRMSVSYTHLC